MEINSKKICYKFDDLFKTIDDLKNFISNSNKFVNVDVIEDKIILLYNELNKLDLKIKYSILDTFLIEKLNFKHKRPNNINFWLERGYGIDEFNEYNSKNNSIELIKPLNESNINTFKYGKFTFKSNGIPKCNLCNNLLDVIPVIGYYKITECSNNKCETHKNINIDTIRQLGFLPIEMFKQKNKRIKFDNKTFKEYWLLKGFSYEESMNQINDLKEKLKDVNKNSFEFYKIISDMTDDEIKIKIKESSKLCIQYWLNKGYTEEESKNEISKIQIKNVACLVKNMNDNPSMYSSYTETQVGYWIKKGFTIEESKLKISERQKTFSLKKCIEKYGEIEGLKKFTERQKKWMDNNKKSNFSKISQKLFWEILKNDPTVKNNNIYFATYLNGNIDDSGKNNEFRLNVTNSYILPDFFDETNGKIIEFDGVYYHRKTPQNETREKKRDEMINECGYEILHINEFEFKNKPQEIINKCIKFLKK